MSFTRNATFADTVCTAHRELTFGNIIVVPVIVATVIVAVIVVAFCECICLYLL